MSKLLYKSSTSMASLRCIPIDEVPQVFLYMYSENYQAAFKLHNPNPKVWNPKCFLG